MQNASTTSGMAARLPAWMPCPVDSDRRTGPCHGSSTTTPTAAPTVATMPAVTRSRLRRVDGGLVRGNMSIGVELERFVDPRLERSSTLGDRARGKHR
jgi:hypothetical protein